MRSEHDKDVAQKESSQHDCPRCGKRLEAFRRHVTPRPILFCLRHGKFWIDDDGRIREERRSTARPKP
jgi:hypothetical protein